jgi:hypothetical protein
VQRREQHPGAELARLRLVRAEADDALARPDLRGEGKKRLDDLLAVALGLLGLPDRIKVELAVG